ncbi:alpha/beta hydrolase [Macrococcus lamae]|nr:alpha/beta hydrolase [Macrococcus lamae]
MLDKIRSHSETAPEEVSVLKDITYKDNQQLDIYYPENIMDRYAVIINVHGGGWVYGDREVYRNYCMTLASMGFAVINYDYRLAPKYKYPAALEDLNDVLHFIKQHADCLKLDLTKLYGIGDSAGAQLLSQYTVMMTNTSYASKYEMKLPELEFKALALNCGIFDPIERISKTSRSPVLWYLKRLLNDYIGEDYLELRELLNFDVYVTTDFPPVFIANSVNDLLVGKQPMILRTFYRNHVPFVYREYGHRDVMSLHNFQLDLKRRTAQNCMIETLTFFHHQN